MNACEAACYITSCITPGPGSASRPKSSPNPDQPASFRQQLPAPPQLLRTTTPRILTMGFELRQLWSAPEINPYNKKAKSIPIFNPFDKYGRVFFFSYLGFFIAFWSW